MLNSGCSRRVAAIRRACAPSTLLLTLLLTSCTGLGPGTPTDASGSAAGDSRTLVMVVRGEPESLASLELARGNTSRFRSVPRLFNAGLALLDGQEMPRPYVAQQLPQLGSDSWRVLPDGQMETTYVLRPNLTWHDGQPLTAEDFAFGWQVYRRSDVAQAGAPLSEIETVTGVDPRTVQIRWRAIVPKAGSLEWADLAPLPGHLLRLAAEKDLDSLRREPFWSHSYVGVGPYQLSRWEPGAYLTAMAFGGHSLGRPKIPQIKVLFAPDSDSVLGALLSGDAQIALDDGLRFAEASELKREWASRGAGTVLSVPNQWRHVEVQHRLDYASPRMVLDSRVRRALALSLDKAALNAGLFNGEAILADSFVPPTSDFFREVDAATAKYPYDPRRAERLMNEAGYTRGSDGAYTHRREGRFSGDLRTNATPLGVAEVGILADSWRREGFEFHETTLPPAQSRLGEARSTFPTLYSVASPLGTESLTGFLSKRVAGPTNSWTGANRGGWVNEEFDVLFDTLSRTLARSERIALTAEMARMVSQSVAAISLYFNPGIQAFATGLQGPQSVAPATDPSWNVYEWQVVPQDR